MAEPDELGLSAGGFSLSLRSANERDLSSFDLHGPAVVSVPSTSAGVHPVAAARSLANAEPVTQRRKSSSAFKSRPRNAPFSSFFFVFFCAFC